MNKIQLAPGIVVYSDVYDGYETLITDIEEGMSSANLNFFEGRADDVVNKKVRDAYAMGIPYINGIDENFTGPKDAFYKSLANIFYKNLVPVEQNYMAEHRINFTDHQAYELLRYGKGQHFSNHVDDCLRYPRRVSSAYYINDNYTGGEINFPRFNVSYKPKANEMIVFPAAFIYNHSVSEVTEGTRYAVVSWIN